MSINMIIVLFSVRACTLEKYSSVSFLLQKKIKAEDKIHLYNMGVKDEFKACPYQSLL